MYIAVIGSHDAPLRVIATADPQAELEGMQRRRADVVRLYHKARVAEPVAETTLEYAYVLLADWKIQRKPDWFQIAPDDAAGIIDRAVAACAVVDRPPPDMTRVRTELPKKVALALHALATEEDASFADLAREAVILLYADRGMPAPFRETT